MNQVVGESHKLEARAFREMLATYRQAEDLINIGAYKQGSNPRIDRAVALYEPMESYLRQDVSEPSDIQSAQQQLQRIIGF
jgi:flagellum-specific ATP synthase